MNIIKFVKNKISGGRDVAAVFMPEPAWKAANDIRPKKKKLPQKCDKNASFLRGNISRAPTRYASHLEIEEA